jgi:hypothetical protein
MRAILGYQNRSIAIDEGCDNEISVNVGELLNSGAKKELS